MLAKEGMNALTECWTGQCHGNRGRAHTVKAQQGRSLTCTGLVLVLGVFLTEMVITSSVPIKM